MRWFNLKVARPSAIASSGLDRCSAKVATRRTALDILGLQAGSVAG
jgi:hypothetical protein